VVDRSRQLVEESPELGEIGGVEGRDSRTELRADLLETVTVARRLDRRAPSARARRAVSRPMPELPPITTTV